MKTPVTRTVLLVLPLMFLAAACGQRDASEDDAVREVAQLYDDYRRAWLRNDASTPDAVLSLFAEDASLLPHHGDPIVSGIYAIAARWFPDGEMSGTVERFEQMPRKTEVSGDLGYVYGRFELDFTYDGTTSRTAGNQLMVARRETDGWRIVALIWSDPPAD